MKAISWKFSKCPSLALGYINTMFVSMLGHENKIRVNEIYRVLKHALCFLKGDCLRVKN